MLLTNASENSRRPRIGLALGLIALLLEASGYAAQSSATPRDQVVTPECGIRPVRRVLSATELNTLLRSDFRGRVIVPRESNWEMKQMCGAYDELGRCIDIPLAYIPLKSCVELVGERGELGSRPVLYTDNKGGFSYTDLSGQRVSIDSYALFDIRGNNIRIEGLHLRGPNNGARDAEDLPHKIAALQVLEDPDPNNDGRADPEEYIGKNVEIADNEFHEWAEAIQIVGRGSDKPCEDYGEPFAGPRVTRAEAGRVRVLRNFLHHNARDSSGYGVVIGRRSYATIEGNVFDFNRHAIAADCHRFNGYIARFNYVLQGGYKYGGWGGYYGAHFDAHGSGTAASRLEGHYDGGGAGEYYLISSNTIRGEQNYYTYLGPWAPTRPAFGLRGKPEIGAFFQDNVVVHESGEAVRLKNGDDGTLDPDDPHSFNLHSSGNRFDVDYSTEVAAGDFDGDRRTDVFVSTGTAWFYSRGGITPWTFLAPSTVRTRDLGFADIDNDGITDVLLRDSAGAITYAKSGGPGRTALTIAPVPMRDLRFGDFDGDKLTDIFYTLQGQWFVWYSKTASWTPTQTSGKSIDDLLFGEFDTVPGTDVVGINNDGWAWSSGSTQPWQRLNARLTSSFANAVVADFDGDGAVDIAFSDGNRWRYSPAGRAPQQVLRKGSGSIKKVLIGRFDGGEQDLAVTFLGGSNLLSIWGPDSGDEFVQRSERNMR